MDLSSYFDIGSMYNGIYQGLKDTIFRITRQFYTPVSCLVPHFVRVASTKIKTFLQQYYQTAGNLQIIKCIHYTMSLVKAIPTSTKQP